MASLLPQAHRNASEVASGHVHAAVAAAAEEAGWEPRHSIGVDWDNENQAHVVTISHGEDGDRVFDHEFGTPDGTPNPVLRTTARHAAEKARPLYVHHLVRQLGGGR